MSYARIYDAVRRVPFGTVATYGQVASLAGLAGHARQVGYALSSLEVDDVPWHRIVNAKGQISDRSDPCSDGMSEQRQLLEAEGIEFDHRGRIHLSTFRWVE